ncbi:DUF4275 family protein [Psychrobacillus sp. AK 1817]|uniref:DUF4275 family protein n=1 Tax=Psychrobacillus sp. AK 1817 TaxID=2303505 RepID=UPI001246E91C|nr:DUF4275 family protein [Psychrobacillus sp. AK 1817]QEY22904.1 DUF4275 family protein [Psychrobacillus sp. AK 1817]
MKKAEIPKWGKYLRGKWVECFANHLSIEEQKDIWLDNFLWHLCSGNGEWTFIMTHEPE